MRKDRIMADVKDTRDTVCEAAFNLTYGWYDREFSKLNGGIAGLNAVLQGAVDDWTQSQDHDEQTNNG